jgi:hypothetical protein
VADYVANSVAWHDIRESAVRSEGRLAAPFDTSTAPMVTDGLGDVGSITGVPPWRIMWAPVIKHNAFIQIISVSFQH